MKLQELIRKVNDKELSKEQLEAYHTELSSLYALMHLEFADIEKGEALFLAESKEKTAVMASRRWAITESGQKQIELKHQIKATEKLIGSVKSRIFNTY